MNYPKDVAQSREEIKRKKGEETCRHCGCWNDFHREGNKCLVWKVLGENCGCPKWESKDNLVYLEQLNDIH